MIKITPLTTPSLSSSTSPTLSTFLPEVTGETISIQTSNSTFHIHVHVLLASPYFTTIIHPHWATAVTRFPHPIDLHHIDSDIFALYAQWLYSHHLDKSVICYCWAEMYILGNNFQDVEFQDAVLEALMQECEELGQYPTLEPIQIIYDETCEGAPVRELLVDMYYMHAPFCKGRKWVDKAPVEFVRDLLARFMERTGVEGWAPWVEEPERYMLGRRKMGKKSEMKALRG